MHGLLLPLIVFFGAQASDSQEKQSVIRTGAWKKFEDNIDYYITSQNPTFSRKDRKDAYDNFKDIKGSLKEILSNKGVLADDLKKSNYLESLGNNFVALSRITPEEVHGSLKVLDNGIVQLYAHYSRYPTSVTAPDYRLASNRENEHVQLYEHLKTVDAFLKNDICLSVRIKQARERCSYIYLAGYTARKYSGLLGAATGTAVVGLTVKYLG